MAQLLGAHCLGRSVIYFRIKSRDLEPRRVWSRIEGLWPSCDRRYIGNEILNRQGVGKCLSRALTEETKIIIIDIVRPIDFKVVWYLHKNYDNRSISYQLGCCIKKMIFWYIFRNIIEFFICIDNSNNLLIFVEENHSILLQWGLPSLHYFFK